MYTPGFEQVTFRYVMKLYTTTWTYRFNVSRMSHVKFVDLYQYQEFADLYQKHADLFILHIKICFLNRPDPGSTNELMDCHGAVSLQNNGDDTTRKVVGLGSHGRRDFVRLMGSSTDNDTGTGGPATALSVQVNKSACVKYKSANMHLQYVVRVKVCMF